MPGQWQPMRYLVGGGMNSVEIKLRERLAWSCGNAGVPTDRAIKEIAAWVWLGQISFRRVRQLSSYKIAKRVIRTMRQQKERHEEILREERERARRRRGLSPVTYPSDID